MRQILVVFLVLAPFAGAVAAPACEVVSGKSRTPVIELYTSEGCSSCPPADKWLSTLKGQAVVAQAFHVAYWDYIGWKDRFASAAHTMRQREVAAANRLNSIYTPQLVRDGRDWRDWRSWRRNGSPIESGAVSGADITLHGAAAGDRFEARVTPRDPASAWTAYWTVTEHGHQSRVSAGENAGEFLKHDFVVRQYAPVGRYQGPQSLAFHAVAARAEHPRQVNLVVADARTGEPLQAVSLQCP
jgi:hypothetical protein